MKAIILAAGRGSRMQYMTDEAPKCLIKIKGTPLIERQISLFKEVGINEIAVVTGYKREKLQKYKLKEFYNNKWSSSQMVYSLFQAEQWLKKTNFIVSYSDIFYEKSALLTLINSKNDLSITYDKNWRSLWGKRFENPLSDAETFLFDENNFLLTIGQKTKSYEDVKGQYMGLLKFSPNGWQSASKFYAGLSKVDKYSMDMTSFLSSLIINKIIKIKVFEYDEDWGEIDAVTDLNFYNKKYNPE